MRPVLDLAGKTSLVYLNRVGQALTMLGGSLTYLTQARRSREAIVKQMVFMGVQSIPVVCIVALFTGFVLGLQSGVELAKFSQEENIGMLVGASMMREMGPVWTAVILAARVGSAMAAELGTMKISDEIDALRVMSIDPLRYLMMPRMVAMVVMAPLLTQFADVVGIVGGGMVGHFQLNIEYSIYYRNVLEVITLTDVTAGLVKSIVFAMTVVTIACFQGMTTQNGAEGVGKAATRTVVYSFLYVLLFDYFITSFFYV